MNFRIGIQDGRYTILYPTGDYRTLRFKTVKEGNLEGKQIIGFHQPGDSEKYWTNFAFMTDEGEVAFWRRFVATNDEPRLRRIRFAVSIIMQDPRKAGLAYAMKEGRCSRCGKELTVPASLHAGLGPECARKGHWTKQDQQAVFQSMNNAQEYATA